MVKRKRCKQCGESIIPKDHQVILITKRDGKILEEVYFHINCWRDYFSISVTNKAKQTVAMMQKQAQGIFENPMIKNVLSQVQGTEQLLGMLNTPLDEKPTEEYILKNDLKEKIKNLNKSKVKKKKNGKPTKRKKINKKN